MWAAKDMSTKQNECGYGQQRRGESSVKPFSLWEASSNNFHTLDSNGLEQLNFHFHSNKYIWGGRTSSNNTVSQQGCDTGFHMYKHQRVYQTNLSLKGRPHKCK